MGSGAVMYVPSLIKIGSGVQKLMGGGGGGYTDTHTQTYTHTHTHTRTATLSYKPTQFFQSKESRLIKMLFMLLFITTTCKMGPCSSYLKNNMRALSSGVKRPKHNLTTHIHLIPSSRMRGALPWRHILILDVWHLNAGASLCLSWSPDSRGITHADKREVLHRFGDLINLTSLIETFINRALTSFGHNATDLKKKHYKLASFCMTLSFVLKIYIACGVYNSFERTKLTT
jgi:hypothetical protein